MTQTHQPMPADTTESLRTADRLANEARTLTVDNLDRMARIRIKLAEIGEILDEITSDKVEIAVDLGTVQYILRETASRMDGNDPPPPPPIEPKKSAWDKLKDSTRMIVAGSLILLGVGQAVAPAAGAHMDAAECLRCDRLLVAEHAAHEAGDFCRVAEAQIRQGRLLEAECTLRELAVDDAQATLLRGLVFRGKGDGASARTMFQKARDLGSKEARDLLAAGVV